MLTYDEIVKRRRAFSLPGYTSLAEVDFDGDWVTPYQISSRHPSGPVLVGKDWLDVPSVEKHRSILQKHGYLPGIPFNRVLEMALQMKGLRREDIYVTQAFHLLPKKRSQNIPLKDAKDSFDAITRHELVGRRVIALGGLATSACLAFNVDHLSVMHPSARRGSYEQKASLLAEALGRSIGRAGSF